MNVKNEGYYKVLSVLFWQRGSYDLVVDENISLRLHNFYYEVIPPDTGTIDTTALCRVIQQ